MKYRRLFLVALVAGAGPAQAKTWERPAIESEVRAVSVSSLFPGSTLDTPDRGLQARASLETQRRVAARAKLGMAGECTGTLWSRFSEAGYLEATLAGWLRSGGTQVRAEGVWTPQRLKFPAELEGGFFERREGRFGARQALTPAARLRVELRLQRDDFVPAFDARDASAAEGYVQLALRTGGKVTLRGEGLLGRTRARSAKYSHADQWVGGGLARTGERWAFDLAVVSGLSRYRDALITDSNFRRRDQTLEVRGELRRAIANGWTAVAGAGSLDQFSSRPDRTYTTQTFRFGLSWTVPSE